MYEQILEELAINNQFAETDRHEFYITNCGCDCEDPYCYKCGPLKYPSLTSIFAPYWYGGIKRPEHAPPPVAPLPIQHPMVSRFERYTLREKNRLYEMTLTLDPKKHPDTDPQFLLSSFHKIIASKQLAVADWLYCIELQENGYPHIHSLLVTTTRVNATKIKQMYPYRMSFELIKSLPKYVEYIYKEEFNVVVQDYCTLHGTSQIVSKEDYPTPAPRPGQAKDVRQKEV